jgi:hypothetical protein
LSRFGFTLMGFRRFDAGTQLVPEGPIHTTGNRDERLLEKTATQRRRETGIAGN